MRPILITALIIGLAVSANAQWSNNPGINNPICTAVQNQIGPAITTDGSGGAIMTWIDGRDFIANDPHIYAQRIDATGVLQWTVNGIVICSAGYQKGYPVIISNGTGGAIIVWEDNRGATGPDIYAQCINAAGITQWTTDGVVICNAMQEQVFPRVISDGMGGAYIAWMDARNGWGNTDIYAQHINAAGSVQWLSNGIGICTVLSIQSVPTLVPDGSGGAIFSWWECFRTGSDSSVYAQRINSDGTILWTNGGVLISTPTASYSIIASTSDNAGGAILSWTDVRSGNIDIYCQRIDSSGVVQWMPNGVSVCTQINDQKYPAITTDSQEGGIIAWADMRKGDVEIYSQRVNSMGVTRWTPDGIEIANNIFDEQHTEIVTDSDGGAFYAWTALNENVYGQRVDSLGQFMWALDSITICIVQQIQYWARIVPSGSEGAIYCWADMRPGTNNDIYAQRINSTGFGSVTEIPENEKMSIYPNPVTDHISIELIENRSRVTATIYNMYGEVMIKEHLVGEPYTIDVSSLSSGLYLISITTADKVLQGRFIKD